LGRRVQLLYFDTNSEMDRKSLRKGSMKAILGGPKLFVFGDEPQLERVLAAKPTRAK